MSDAPKAWTVLDLIRWTSGFLKGKGIENGRREAEELLGHVLDLDRLKLYLAFETLPNAIELERFRALVARRAKREPLQYLIGSQRFLGVTLKLDSRALIPRPETEFLAEMALERFKPLGAAGRFADLGTGSGCIALALLAGSEGAGIATDISEEALSLARENAAAAGLESRLRFLRGAGLLPLQEIGVKDLDLLISNPPYIPLGDREGLQPEVRDFEPPSALFAGEDGLELLRTLATGAEHHVRPGGWLMLEGGAGHPEKLMPLLSSDIWKVRETVKDQFGIQRYLLAQRAS
ncbi:MAG: peptide chain release factor N(5)-glutamine methyltransferase [candidate division FCPU426 bacterium]